jgi:hypothetical protein
MVSSAGRPRWAMKGGAVPEAPRSLGTNCARAILRKKGQSAIITSELRGCVDEPKATLHKLADKSFKINKPV